MPSFGVSVPSKEGSASVDVSLPKADVDVALPSVKGEVKAGDLSVELPSVEVDVKGVAIEAHVPEAEAELGDLKGKAGSAGIKGHLPKVHMPSIKMPQLPKADIKGPKVDVTMPSVDVSLLLGKVDIKSPDLEVEGVKLEGDIKLGDKDAEGKDSKFKMPKFKMPSFGVSSPSKKIVTPVAVSLPKGDVVKSLSSSKSDVMAHEVPLAPATDGRKEEEIPTEGQESWFKMPKFRMPSFGRSSSKEKKVVLDTEVVPVVVPAALTQSEIQVPEETYADVLKRNIDDKGLKLCQPTAGILDSTISVSEVRVPSGENSVSVLMPSLRFSTSEMKADGTVGFSKPEMYLPPTEGPIKFKASSTEIPSQVSVIETGRVWEGSVLTVKFPKLQVPKFTFQAPSTESDIFIPQVREIACPETDIEIAVHKESPEEWSAKVLKAVSEVPPQPSPDPVRPPKDLALTSIASPISKVKVHIQGAHIESQEVTVESRVTCEHGELPRRETFSTQIVRASEIPPSGIQTPSYGFSLLKVKIPESYTSSAFKMQDTSEESLRKDESGVDTVDLSLEGELQPETGEPYEIISSSANLPKLKTFTFEVHSSHQYVDSYSDEEPAEILEFPPEDTHGQTPPDEEEKEQKVQLESKKSSGLFRFWLPNIGFSSSTDASNSDSKAEVSKSVPIETQPEARSDIELPKKSEKTGWFRFPKLGFSSSPAKKSEAEESEAEPTKAGSQEEAEQTVTFFDAQETLSPEDKEGSEAITSTNKDDIQDTSALITSSARTELILLEQEGKTTGRTVSGPVAK
uniref:Uncharacterized protein n=1 Tax=Monodelphis domestica TaxID=13616 RepID=A0A5F8GL73_MONDO